MNVKAGAKQVQADGKEIIINEATVSCEESHESYQVPVRIERSDDAVIAVSILEHQKYTKQEGNEAVSDISEHDPEEEGECHSCEKGRISLLISGNTVSINDLLGRHPIIVKPEVCRHLRVAFLHQSRNWSLGFRAHFVEYLLNFLNIMPSDVGFSLHEI